MGVGSTLRGVLKALNIPIGRSEKIDLDTLDKARLKLNYRLRDLENELTLTHKKKKGHRKETSGRYT